MKISFKTIIYLWIGLFVIIGGLFINGYSKLEPESFIAQLTKQVQKNYPGTQLSVGKVDYGFALDFKISLTNIILRRSSEILGSAGEVEIKVPWWLLVFNRGNAQVNVSDLEIFVDNDRDTESTPSVVLSKPINKTVTVSLPDYLSDAHYTFRAKNVTIKDLRTDRRYMTLSKLLVREFQIGRNSAFELTIPIEISHKKVKYLSELWLFGDVTPGKETWQINYRGEFRTKDTSDKYQIEDLVIDGKATLNPGTTQIDSELSFTIDNEAIGKGSLRANEKEYAIALKLEKLPMTFLGIIDDEVRNPFLSVSEGHASGTINFIKKVDQETPNLSCRISFDSPFNLGDQAVAGKWQITMNDSRLDTSFISPKGELSFFRRSVVDFEQGSISQYSEELGFTGIDAVVATAPLMRIQELMMKEGKPYFTSTLNFKDCPSQEVMLNGSFKYGITPGQKFYQMEASTGPSGKMHLDYQQKSLAHSLSLKFESFQWVPYLKILDPYFTLKEGQLDGSLEGKWMEDWKQGQSLVNLKMTKAQEPVGEWMTYFQTLWQSFEIDSSTVGDQSWNFLIKNKSMKLNVLALESADPAKLTGQLYNSGPQKSFLVLSYPKNKKWKPVKKEVPELFKEKSHE